MRSEPTIVVSASGLTRQQELQMKGDKDPNYVATAQLWAPDQLNSSNGGSLFAVNDRGYRGSELTHGGNPPVVVPSRDTSAAADISRGIGVGVVSKVKDRNSLTPTPYFWAADKVPLNRDISSEADPFLQHGWYTL